MVFRLIIDTDPGIDDSMAIACAFNSPDVDIIGLTTIFGNVGTNQATQNACFLRQLAGRDDVTVAKGAEKPMVGVLRDAASFVHGHDGFGNTNQEIVKENLAGISAAQFIAEAVLKEPRGISILALGPLTNIALAFQLDKSVASSVEEIIILGGAFYVEGNVNPAAEANILGDPQAADFVFAQTDRIRIVGLDVTHRCLISSANLQNLGTSKGKFGPFLHKAVQYYLSYHRSAYGIESVYAHDPTAFVAVTHPELFKWQEGPVRVVCDGWATGKTLQDPGRKRWNSTNAWTGRVKVKVAVGVDADAVVALILDLMDK